MRGQNLLLKCYQPLELLIYFGKGFNTGNIGSVDQRPAKLLAVKVGVLKKKSAVLVIPPIWCAISFDPGSIPGAVQSFSKFDSQQL